MTFNSKRKHKKFNNNNNTRQNTKKFLANKLTGETFLSTHSLAQQTQKNKDTYTSSIITTNLYFYDKSTTKAQTHKHTLN